jgi:hypothetical protein
MTDDKKYQYFIYKIYNPDCDYVYVGSTRNMAVRKKCHKSNCNNVNCAKYNYKVYKTIRENDGWENWYMIPIEVMDNVTKLTAEMREDVYRVDLNATMNSQSATRGDITIQEYKKNYNRQYNQDNREQITAKRQQKHDCLCGRKYTYQHKARHIKTKKHQAYVLSLAK